MIKCQSVNRNFDLVLTFRLVQKIGNFKNRFSFIDSVIYLYIVDKVDLVFSHKIVSTDF